MTMLMKGHSWKDRGHKMTYPCRVEAKHDEIRCEVRIKGTQVEFLSYAGKPLHNLENFASRFVCLAVGLGLRGDDTLTLDIGVEVNGSFNDSYRWVRSSKGAPEGLDMLMVKFYLFDMPDMAGIPYKVRLKSMELCQLMGMMNYGLPLHLVDGQDAANAEEVEAVYNHYRDIGLEGAMVKSFDHTYKPGKRTDGWLKMKPEDDADGVIVGFVQAVSIHGVPLPRAGSVIVRCEDGSTATPAGIAHDLGAEMHENPEKFLGQWVQFKYMMRDRKGGYRHPSFVRFREDK